MHGRRQVARRGYRRKPGRRCKHGPSRLTGLVGAAGRAPAFDAGGQIGQALGRFLFGFTPGREHPAQRADVRAICTHFFQGIESSSDRFVVVAHGTQDRGQNLLRLAVVLPIRIDLKSNSPGDLLAKAGSQLVKGLGAAIRQDFQHHRAVPVVTLLAHFLGLKDIEHRGGHNLP